jgi:DNA-binding XRE family transcriptional regulator
MRELHAADGSAYEHKLPSLGFSKAGPRTPVPMGAARADDVLRDLGRRVAELRAARGLTQERFAEEADITAQYLQRVEAGRENMTVRSLVRMASLLHVSITDLFAKPAQREVRPGRPRRERPR